MVPIEQKYKVTLIADFRKFDSKGNLIFPPYYSGVPSETKTYHTVTAVDENAAAVFALSNWKEVNKRLVGECNIYLGGIELLSK